MILSCALSAGAAIVIASDRDLLELNHSPKIHSLEVIDVAEACRRFVAA
jgi:predicted nucleic acid-binding protein